MNLKNIKIALISITVLIILNFFVFLFFFHNQTVSKNISDWANFADYISGTTSILISFMTLLVTLFIAYEISNLEEKRNALNIQYDRDKFKRELREKEYADITDNFNNFWLAITNENRRVAKDSLFIIRQRFVSFIQHKKHLFPDLNPKEFQNLDKTLIEILNLSRQNLEVDNPKSVELVDKLQKELSLFHKRIQEYIISDK